MFESASRNAFLIAGKATQGPLTLRRVDPLIRELTQYRDLIQQGINFEERNP